MGSCVLNRPFLTIRFWSRLSLNKKPVSSWSIFSKYWVVITPDDVSFEQIWPSWWQETSALSLWGQKTLLLTLKRHFFHRKTNWLMHLCKRAEQTSEGCYRCSLHFSFYLRCYENFTSRSCLSYINQILLLHKAVFRHPPLFFLRCTLDSTAGQHCAWIHGGNCRWSHTRSFIPVSPVCCQWRGQGPVQQGNWSVGKVSVYFLNKYTYICKYLFLLNALFYHIWCKKKAINLMWH